MLTSNTRNIFETVLNSIEGHQLLDGLFMNYFQCDQISGDLESLLKFTVSLAKGYSTLQQVKRHMHFQLERYLAVGLTNLVACSHRVSQVLQERLDEGELYQ